MAWQLRLASLGAWGAASLLAPSITQALPARTLRFPRDFGSHPELRTEWWYITGHAQAGGGCGGFR
jgi:predicted secreted hydrolase